MQAGAVSNTPQVGRPTTLVRRVGVFLEAIKFEHSVFALPFAVLSAFLLAGGVPQLAQLGWVIVAMVGGRTFAMGANRLIDAEIDARNPRTSKRAVPAGILKKRDVAVFMAAALLAFGVAVSQLDRMAWYFSPVVIAVMVFYPYTKRFTWLCHLALGLVYLIVPPAVWLAMAGRLESGIVVLGGGAMLWVAGFDVLYATADVRVDREQGIRSVPSRFGIPAALWWARALHTGAVVLLAWAGLMLGAGPLYFVGLAAAGLLLAYENSLVKPGDLSKLNMAFFTMNGVIAVVFGAFVCVDAVVSGGGLQL